jgi:hypothetical protein
MRRLLVPAMLVITVTLLAAQRSNGQTPRPQEASGNQDCPSKAPDPDDVHSAPRNERERLRMVAHLVQMHTLHDAALANGGHFEMEVNPHVDLGGARDLDTLGASSDLVVVGMPTHATVQVAPDGKRISTYYEVAILDALKGPPSGVVLVKVSGGSVTCSDGSVIEVVTPDFEIRTGKRYAFFLQPAPTGIGTNPADHERDVHVLTLSSQGIFEVSSGRVVSMARPNDAVRLLYEGFDSNAFVERARTLTTAGGAGQVTGNVVRGSAPAQSPRDIPAGTDTLMIRGGIAGDGRPTPVAQSAAIAGRVLDELGRPMPKAVVIPFRQQFSLGQRRLSGVTARATTDDNGEYRISGLPPGQYYVTASVSPAYGAIGRPTSERDFALTFYPGTSDVAAARPVTVAVEQTVNEINIVVRSMRLAAITGIVAVDARGVPQTTGGVTINPRGGVMPGRSTPIRPDGSFTFDKVAPGEYLLQARIPRPPSPPAPGQSPGPLNDLFSTVVTVSGEDVTGIRLKPVTPITISGRVHFDDPRAAQSVRPSAIRLSTLMLDARMETQSASTVTDDFEFELRTAPGRLAFRAAVTLSDARDPWQLKAVRINSADVIDSAIEIDRDLSDVEIVLTTRVQQVSGLVTDVRGAPLNDSVVVLFAQDPSFWSAAPGPYVAVGRSNARGAFKVATLRPGVYYAIALDRVEDNAWQDPELLERLSRQAFPFSLREGEMQTIDLTSTGSP